MNMAKLVSRLGLPSFSLNMRDPLSALIAVLHALKTLDSLDGKSPWHLHALRNMFLILLSLLFLPLSNFMLVATYMLQPLFSTHTTGRRVLRMHPFVPLLSTAKNPRRGGQQGQRANPSSGLSPCWPRRHRSVLRNLVSSRARAGFPLLQKILCFAEAE